MGVLPAVDVGKSVSRVGGKAQLAAFREVAGDLKLAYAQFSELETFARFGARLDEDSRKIILHGKRIRSCLQQPEFDPVSVPEQIALMLALTARLFDTIPEEKMVEAQKAIRTVASSIHEELIDRLKTAKKLVAEDRAAIVEIAKAALLPLQPKSDDSAPTKEPAPGNVSPTSTPKEKKP